MRTAYVFGKQETSIVVAHLSYFLILAVGTYLTPRMAGLEQNNIIDIWNVSALPAVLATVIVLATLAGGEKKPSVLFLHLILLTLVTPSLLVFVSGGLPWSFAGITVVAFLVVALLTKAFSLPVLWRGFLTSAGLMWLCIVAITAYTIAILIINGFQYVNFSIWKVYEMRNLVAASLPRVFGYLTPIVTGILIPIAAVEAARRKDWILMVLLVVLGIFLFGATSYKGIALNALVSIIFYWMSTQKKPIEYLALFLMTGIVVSSLETQIAHFTQNMAGYDRGIFSSLFLRRFLLVPSILNWAYVDYFSGIGQFYWWSTSRITLGLVQNPFGVPPPLLIGTDYFKDPTLWANAGWIASGFANASYLGVLLYSVGFGVVLSAMDALGKRLGMPFVVGCMTLTIWKMATTTDFLTAFLTHGLLIGLLLLMLVRDNGLRPVSNVNTEGPGPSRALEGKL